MASKGDPKAGCWCIGTLRVIVRVIEADSGSKNAEELREGVKRWAGGSPGVCVGRVSRETPYFWYESPIIGRKELHIIELRPRACWMSYKIRDVVELVSVKRASLALEPRNRHHLMSSVGYVELNQCKKIPHARLCHDFNGRHAVFRPQVLCCRPQGQKSSDVLSGDALVQNRETQTPTPTKPTEPGRSSERTNHLPFEKNRASPNA